MIIDMRYHIASLVAVFLALGIGILIGSAVLGERVLVQQQESLIQRLESDINRVSSEKRELSKEVSALKQDSRVATRFGQSVLPLLVADRLFGQQVAIIRAGYGVDPKLVEELSNSLRLAGAEVVSTTSILQDFGSLDEEKRTSLAGILGVADADSAALPEEAARGLAREIAKGMPSLAVSFLAESQAVTVSGSYRTPVNTVIVIGGSTDEAHQNWKTVESPLVDGLKQAGVVVAGVEPTSIKVSEARYFKQKGILTVDNIDSVPGQVALIYGLAGGKRGAYGVKETAKQLLPIAGESIAP